MTVKIFLRPSTMNAMIFDAAYLTANDPYSPDTWADDFAAQVATFKAQAQHGAPQAVLQQPSATMIGPFGFTLMPTDYIIHNPAPSILRAQ